MGELTAIKIEAMIFQVRSVNVILDTDLAKLYGVETRILNRNVKRNLEKFPGDFLIKLSNEEWENLRSQIGISSSYGGRRYPPYAFTEYGIAALSGVLNSPVAIEVNIRIIRAFVNMKKSKTEGYDIFQRILKLESDSEEFVQVFEIIFEKIDKLQLQLPSLPQTRKKIGLVK